MQTSKRNSTAMAVLNAIIPNVGIVISGGELVYKEAMPRFNEKKLALIHRIAREELMQKGYNII